MKTYLFISTLMLSLLGSSAVLAAERAVTLQVENMTCTSCRHIVSRSMSGVDGVLKVEVSYKARQATVAYDDTLTTPEQIAEASTTNGYPATPVQPTP